MSTQRASRENRSNTLRRIPVPRLTAESVAKVSAAVEEYRSARLHWLTAPNSVPAMEQRCHDALLRIDAELLAAYDLPPKIERELLNYFAGHRRPGPVEFDRYYPESFRPALPLRMLVSGELQRASAVETLRRLPVLHDSAISEMVAELE